MKNNNDEISEAISTVPKDLPPSLSMLTTAGHLLAKGFDVQEASLHEDGAPCRALIFAPILLGEEGDGKIDGHLDAMFEIRVNTLLTLQEAAEECGVNYRTIQRWRDENKVPVFRKGDKQLFASEILKDYAAKKGHIRGRLIAK